jgi:hypothetical protein
MSCHYFRVQTVEEDANDSVGELSAAAGVAGSFCEYVRTLARTMGS